MPRWRVVVPVYLRHEEIHYVWAPNEDEALDAAFGSDPAETVEDVDYYEVVKSGAVATKVSSAVEDLAEAGMEEE